MDLDTIQSMWEQDCVIDDVMLDESSKTIPQLHSKYLNLYNQFKLLRTKCDAELKTIRHKKWLYYSGKIAPEDEEPFNYKVMKSDVPQWVSVDEQVIKIETKMEYYETVIYSLSEILRQINNRNYVIKNMIEWRRFTNGV